MLNSLDSVSCFLYPQCVLYICCDKFNHLNSYMAVMVNLLTYLTVVYCLQNNLYTKFLHFFLHCKRSSKIILLTFMHIWYGWIKALFPVGKNASVADISKKDCNSSADCELGLVCKVLPRKLDFLQRSLLLLMLGLADNSPIKMKGRCTCPDGYHSVSGTPKCLGEKYFNHLQGIIKLYYDRCHHICFLPAH